MANGFLQMAGFIFSIVGTIMTIIICIRPEWKVNDTQGEVIENIRRSHGLWISVSSTVYIRLNYINWYFSV